MAEIDTLRETVRRFWADEPVACPRHPGATLRGVFVETTYSDHIVFECSRGGETITVPQRPRQQEFNSWQTEGLVVYVERGDDVLCFRCQSKLAIDREGLPSAGHSRFSFTCVRCLSWGLWEGDPRKASIEAPRGVKST